MDAALLRKINIYPTGAGRPGLERDTDFTHSKVVEPDPSMFHGADDAGAKDTPEAEPELDYDTGFKDGKAQSDLMYQNTISVMQQTLASLQSEMSKVRQHIEKQHLAMVQACLNATFPALMAAGSGQEILALITQITEQGVKGKIQFIVHPDAQDTCQRLCELQVSDFTITTDPTLTPQQVRVSWEQGGSEIDCESTAHSIEMQLDAALQSLND